MLGYWSRNCQPLIFSAGVTPARDLGYSLEPSPFAIAAVAKFDNYLTLCDTLQLSHQATLTNEQLILQAYGRWGDRCCDYLLGAYSFVVWDARSTTFFCARDHVGCIPFYYSLTSEQFVFGTSLNDILSTGKVSQNLDERFVRTRLADKHYRDNQRTFYQAVRKLPPGHTLTVTPESAEVKRYWFPENSPEKRLPNDDAYVTAFVELLQTAIAEQTPSQVKVGVHLTGGLDSSTIAAAVARELRQRHCALPLAYCWLPQPAEQPLPFEHHLIEQVRAQESLTLRFQQLTATDVQRSLARDLTLLPSAEMLIHEQIVMHQAKQDNLQVLLSGWGGDELIAFNGRGYYAGLLRSWQWHRLWHESKAVNPFPLQHIWRQGILPQYPWLQTVYQRVRVGQWRQPLQHYLHPDFMHEVAPYPQQPWRHLNTRQIQLALLNHGHLCERMEAWADLGAKHNLLYRYPLLDKRIVEFSLGLPPDMFRRGQWNRWLMRKAAARLLPDDVAWNTDKSDPIRCAALKLALREGLSQIGQQLQAQATLPSRATYLDMPRLLADLSADNLANRASGLGKLSDAVMFLDF